MKRRLLGALINRTANKQLANKFIQSTLVLFVLLFSCHSRLTVDEVHTENIRNDREVIYIDSSIIRLIEPYKKNMDAELSEVIGKNSEAMIKGKPESALTNYLADLLRAEGELYLRNNSMIMLPVVSYQNYGGIRSGLPKGEITVRDIFGIMPFENAVVLLKLKGTDMKELADRIAARGGDSMAGMNIGINNGKAQVVEIDGKPLDEQSEYWLVTNDYVAKGGDSMDMLGRCLEFVETGTSIRDCLINGMKSDFQKGKIIPSATDGRIYLINEQYSR